jgi:hypothetical protein
MAGDGLPAWKTTAGGRAAWERIDMIDDDAARKLDALASR